MWPVPSNSFFMTTYENMENSNFLMTFVAVLLFTQRNFSKFSLDFDAPFNLSSLNYVSKIKAESQTVRKTDKSSVNNQGATGNAKLSVYECHLTANSQQLAAGKFGFKSTLKLTLKFKNFRKNLKSNTS